MRREELTIRGEMQVLKIHCDEIDGSWLNGWVTLQFYEKTVDVCSLGTGAWRDWWIYHWAKHSVGEGKGAVIVKGAGSGPS
jgi:hypothetical protein